MEKTGKYNGKAYAFFYCKASKVEIEAELPTIRELVRTPSKLELSLTEGTDNTQGDEKLKALAQEANQAGLNYMLHATYPNATNKKTADEVAAILNQAYQSPLYADKEEFRGDIVYKEKDEYVFRD
jgi:hypothetical protein